MRCVKGAVLDVAVDIRKGSSTYGQHVECLLCAHDEEGERIAREYENKSRSSAMNSIILRQMVASVFWMNY